MSLGYYEQGSTSLFACRFDQRFSYCLYVPQSYPDSAPYPIIVVVHGTERAAQGYRDQFIDFAETHQCVVFAPLFPCGIDEPGEVNNYKFIRYRDIRFDHVLLAMIDEISEKYQLQSERLLMHGFSGGGHFVHRFFYLHPQRVAALSVGAPGVVTLLDQNRDWWVGVHDLEVQFGVRLNLDAMRHVPVQMVIGEDDTETWEITITPDDDLWMEGANDAGRDRKDRIRSLAASFQAVGIQVQIDTVPQVAHEGFKLLPAVKTFFAGILQQRRLKNVP